MFLLVNLEDHRSQMGEIIASLVNTYSVPISIVDKVEKLCPKCSRGEKLSSETPSTVGDPIQFSCSPSPVPSKSLEEESQSAQPTSTSGVGRRTAAKQSAIVKALEVKPVVSKPDPEFRGFNMVEAPSSSDVHGNLTSYPVDMDIAVMDRPPMEIAGDNEDMQEDNGTFDADSCTSATPPVNYESLHPSLLACLLSATPNMFGQNDANGDATTSSHHGENTPSQAATSREKDTSSEPKSRSLGHVVSVTGKVRRGRVVYSQSDLKILETYYNEDPNACANPSKKKMLMSLLGVDAVRLKVWFQNRRRKDKINWLNSMAV